LDAVFALVLILVLLRAGTRDGGVLWVKDGLIVDHGEGRGVCANLSWANFKNCAKLCDGLQILALGLFIRVRTAGILIMGPSFIFFFFNNVDLMFVFCLGS
jgi:hypothetical protein